MRSRRIGAMASQSVEKSQPSAPATSVVRTPIRIVHKAAEERPDERRSESRELSAWRLLDQVVALM